MKTNNEDYVEIDLLKLGKALWHRAWLIVLTMVIGGALAFSYAFFLATPMYEASAMLYINNSSIALGSTKVSISSGDLSASQGLIDTYSVILKSRMTLETVIETAELPYDYEELKEMIVTGAVDGTEVMEIRVTDADAAEAAEITNTIVDILPDKIVSIVEGSSVQIVDYAVVPVEPVSPDIKKYTLIGILLGFVLCAGVIILRAIVDTVIRSEEYLLESYSDIPVLSVIPDLVHEKHGSDYYYSNEGNPGAGRGTSLNYSKSEETV